MIRTNDVRIAAGQSLSTAPLQRADDLRGLYVPAGFEGTYVSFVAAERADAVFRPVYNGDGDEVLLPVTAGGLVGVPQHDADALRGAAFLKIRAGSSISPVVQAADRLLRVVLGGV